MGDQRTRMLIGGALQGGATGFLNQRARDRDEKADQVERDREDAKIERERRDRDQAAGLSAAGEGIEDRRVRLRTQIASNPELAGRQGLPAALEAIEGQLSGARTTRQDLRGQRQEDPEAFRAGTGRQELRGARQTIQALTPEQKPGKLKEREDAALKLLSEATTAKQLQDAILQVEADAKVSRRVRVRKALNAARGEPDLVDSSVDFGAGPESIQEDAREVPGSRLEAFESAETLEQKRKRDLKNAGSGGVGAGPPLSEFNPDLEYPPTFDAAGYVKQVESGSKGSRGTEANRVLKRVTDAAKKYAVQSGAYNNLMQVIRDPNIAESKGPGAIMVIYQFLRSQDNSVVREGEIRLFQTGLNMAGRFGIAMRNLADSVGYVLGEELTQQQREQLEPHLRNLDLNTLLADSQIDQIQRIATIMATTGNAQYRDELPPNVEGQYMVMSGGNVPDLFSALRLGGDEGGGAGGATSDEALNAWADQ